MEQKDAPLGSFGSLLGKLVQVPKEEMQAEEAKWQAMRQRLKDKGESKGKEKRKKSADE